MEGKKSTYRKIVGILICVLFFGTCFNIIPIIPNTVRADSNSNLAAYWNFDEGSGTVVHDSSGNGYDGKNFGSSWVSGKFGYGLEITGTDRVEDIPFSFDNSIKHELTIAAWIKWYGPGDYDRCQIFDGRYDLGHGILFSIYPSGKLGFSIQSSSTIYSNSSVPSDGVWTHVAAVFDDFSDLLKIFINGQLDGTLTTKDTFRESGYRPFIGNDPWAQLGDIWDWAPLNGVIDDLHIFNRALNSSEIQYLINPGEPPDLIIENIFLKGYHEWFASYFCFTVRNIGGSLIYDKDVEIYVRVYWLLFGRIPLIPVRLFNLERDIGGSLFGGTKLNLYLMDDDDMPLWGYYRIFLTINPNRLIYESNFDNNLYYRDCRMLLYSEVMI